MSGDPAIVPIAYLTTSYPSLSHTFILREVLALRRRGFEIHTISLRRTAGEHLLSRDNREASATTFAVRPPRRRAGLQAHMRALSRHPLAYLRTLHEALRLARAGGRGRLWQVFYFAEAIIVWRHCAQRGARHIHAHHASPPADVALLAAHFGEAAGEGPATWSLTMHGSTEFWDIRWFGLAEKIRRARMVVCISDFTRSQLMALVEERHWPKLRVVHCGVTPGEYAGLPAAHADRPQILCVGRLVREKGHAILLQALARLHRQGYEPLVVFVGSGPTRESLERLAHELALEGQLSFAGAVGQDQIKRYYAESSIVCLPSFAEGLPVVLIEAMACGRPVVASAVAGVRELIRDGRTGLLVAPGNPDELAQALGTLISSAELRETLASAGRRQVVREFDIERSADQLDGLFRAMLEPADVTDGADASAEEARDRSCTERSSTEVLAGSAVSQL
ncbi:MAG: glycosyltransferase family 4 protein [Solirubrobacteraceae bacterium]